MSDPIVEVEKTSKSILERQLEAFQLAFEKAQASGSEHAMERVAALAMSICAIWNRQAARDEHESNLIISEKLKDHVKNVQSTFNSITSLVLKCITGGLSIAGGALQLSSAFSVRTLLEPRYYEDMVGNVKAKTLNTIGGSLSSVGQGTQAFSGIADASSESTRSGYHHVLEENKRQRDAHHQNSQQSDSRTRDTLSSMKDTENGRHRAMESV